MQQVSSVLLDRKELSQLNGMERSLINRWSNVLCMMGDERNVMNTDNHKLVSALGMAIGHTRRNCLHFNREAIGAPEAN